MVIENQRTLASEKLAWMVANNDDIQTVIDNFLLAKKSEGVGVRTLNLYGYMLSKFGQWIVSKGISLYPDITANHFREYISLELERVKPRAAHVVFRTLRTLSYWYEAENEGVYTSPFHRLHAPKIPKDTRNIADGETLIKLIEACKGENKERDEALLLTFFDGGLRASELCGLRVMDIAPLTGEIKIIEGKGKKDREIYVGKRTLRAIKKMLRKRGTVDIREPLFENRQGEHFNYSGLRSLIKRLEDRAGVKLHGLHSLRRGFATSFLRNGGDLLTLSRLLGHEELDTTRLYVGFSSEQLQSEHRRNSPVEGLRSLR